MRQNVQEALNHVYLMSTCKETLSQHEKKDNSSKNQKSDSVAHHNDRVVLETIVIDHFFVGRNFCLDMAWRVSEISSLWREYQKDVTKRGCA